MTWSHTRVASSFIALVPLLWPMVALTQPAAVRAADVRVGSEGERYLRALSLLAPRTDDGPVSWMVRPAAGERALRALAGIPGPWAIGRPEADGLRLVGADAIATFNSGLPSYEPDGPAWSGRGANLRLSATGGFARGRLRARLAPMAWVAQNAAFDLVPTTGPFPYSDPATPLTVDLPQRFGDGALARVDAGESELEYGWAEARVALTSAAAQLGPGTDHALLLQGNAGGIPRLEVGTTDGIDTRLGRLGMQLGWGRTPHTAWAPDRRTGALFTSFLMLTWRPAFAEELEVGFTRLNHRDWERITLRELLVPFGSVYAADWVGGSYDTSEDNQLASLFMRFRVPGAGLEFFAEYGKNDRSRDWRDQLLELDHNAAWLGGLQKAWRAGRDDAELWAMNLTIVSGAIAPIARVRGQAYFYEHEPLRQGHTLRGQLLGTPLLQREGGAEVRVDRWDAKGRTGVALRTRALPNELAEAVAPELVRQEWSLAVDATRFTATGAWTARLGALADLGHSPVAGDAYSVQLGLGWSRR